MKDGGYNKKKREDRKEETGVFFGGDRWAVWRRACFGFKLEIEKKNPSWFPCDYYMLREIYDSSKAAQLQGRDRIMTCDGENYFMDIVC